MSNRADHSNQQNEAVASGVARLVSRAGDSRSVSVLDLTARVQLAVEKYVLRDTPNASAREIGCFIDALHADDLCHVVACEQGDENAWADLVNRFGATVRSAARSASSNEEAAEELAQTIWAELYGVRTRADGTPAGKIGYYSGRGSLGGWLRAVVAQLAVDHHRRRAKLVQTEDDAEFDALARASEMAGDGLGPVAAAENPEDAVGERRAASDVERALESAIRDLNPEDKLLVKLYYFDGLTMREAGAVLGFHEATASRRLARIHRDLRKTVESLLINERGWTKGEAGRYLSSVAEGLQTDLAAMFTAGSAAQGPD